MTSFPAYNYRLSFALLNLENLSAVHSRVATTMTTRGPSVRPPVTCIRGIPLGPGSEDFGVHADAASYSKQA